MVNDGLDLYTLSDRSSDTSLTALRIQTNVVALSLRLSIGFACLQCKVLASIDTCYPARSWCVYVVGCYGQSLAYCAAISVDVKLNSRRQTWSRSILSDLVLVLGIIQSRYEQSLAAYVVHAGYDTMSSP